MLEKLDFCPLTDSFKDDLLALIKKHGIETNKTTDYVSLAVMMMTSIKEKIESEKDDGR